MRFWKKVSAMVAMAAVCMTMAVPVVASAEVDARMGACPGGCDWKPGTGTQVKFLKSHIYGNGLSCAIEEVTLIYYKRCDPCGTIQIYATETYTRHTACGQ